MIAPVPAARPIVRVPAAPVEGMIVGIASDVPVAFWKFRKVTVPVADVRVARLDMPDAYRLVVVTLVKVVLPKLEMPETYKLVEVTPIPAIVRPPSMVVVTLVEPMWIPPMALRPVPIEMVVVPGPVPRLTVDEVPIPKDRV